MDEQIQSFLAALREGEVAAVLPLADYLQDSGHPLAKQITQHAMVVLETESYLEMIENLAAIVELLTTNKEKANGPSETGTEEVTGATDTNRGQ